MSFLIRGSRASTLGETATFFTALKRWSASVSLMAVVFWMLTAMEASNVTPSLPAVNDCTRFNNDVRGSLKDRSIAKVITGS